MPIARRYLFVTAMFVIRGVYGQDLLLDTESGSLVVSNIPPFSFNPSTPSVLNTGQSSALTLAVYNYADAQVSASCTLPVGASVLLTNGTQYASIAIGANYAMTVSAIDGSGVTTGNFGLITLNPPSAYQNYQLNSTTSLSPFISFSVVGVGSTCDSVTAYAGQPPGYYVRISTQNSAIALKKKSGGGNGDPWTPISGGSLMMLAPPGGSKFQCSSDSRAATLTGLSSAVRLGRPRPTLAYENDVPLDGIGNWRITVYPQQLVITRNGRGTYNLRLPSNSAFKLDCDGNNGSMIGRGAFMREVAMPGVRPQEFVIDWSPGLFQSRRYVTIPCGNCKLGLQTKGKP